MAVNPCDIGCCGEERFEGRRVGVGSVEGSVVLEVFRSKTYIT